MEASGDLQTRPGFNESFLGPHIPSPAFASSIAGDALVVAGRPFLPYEHFSLALSLERRMARWVAWNIDGATLIEDGSVGREDLDFRCDPRIGLDRQIVNDVYTGNILDRGHIARRADLLWGSRDEALRANADSFYFPNITPQAEAFNQSSKSGLWGRLENALLGQISLTDHRVSVFGGPIFRPTDRRYRTVLVPEAFWKLFVYRLDDTLRSKAFVLTQDLAGLERDIELPEWHTYEETIQSVEAMTELEFGVIGASDTTAIRGEADGHEPLGDVDQIVW